MYNVVRKVIEAKRYELKDMLKKIDTLWVQGNLDDNSRAELISLARGNALTGNSVDMLAKLEEIDRRLKAVEDAISAKDSTEEGDTIVDVEEGENVEGTVTPEEPITPEEPEEPVVVTYPEFQTGKWYYAGDIVAFGGANYRCVAPTGTPCVWSPSDYPNFWDMIIEETATEEVAEEPTE